MILPAFDIGNTDLTGRSEDCRLLIEVSAQSLNYLIVGKDNRELLLMRQYRLYTTADKPVHDVLEEIIESDEILRQYADKALIVYNFPEAGIIPAEHFDIRLNGPVTRLIHGDAGSGFIFDERIDDGSMYNVYSVPKDIHLLFKHKFAGSRSWHFYTLWLLTTNTGDFPAQQARLVFYHDKFILSFFDNGSLQIIQTFNYHTPEDVAYYLLLVCRQLNLEAKAVRLAVSGLIDTQSALFTELQKYFLDVHCENVPDDIVTHGLLEDFPQHYFSPLLKMSLCVS